MESQTQQRPDRAQIAFKPAPERSKKGKSTDQRQITGKPQASSAQGTAEAQDLRGGLRPSSEKHSRDGSAPAPDENSKRHRTFKSVTTLHKTSPPGAARPKQASRAAQPPGQDAGAEPFSRHGQPSSNTAVANGATVHKAAPHPSLQKQNSVGGRQQRSGSAAAQKTHQDTAPREAEPAASRRGTRLVSASSRLKDSVVDFKLPSVFDNGAGTADAKQVQEPTPASAAEAAPPPEAVRDTSSPKCCFCHRPGDEEGLGGLGRLSRTSQPALDRKKQWTYLYFHEPCAAYGGGMGAIPTTLNDVEEDIISEYNRSAALHCMHCKARKAKPTSRATLGCAHNSCRVSLHYTCAREMAADRKIFFAQGPREIVCAKHKQWYLKNKKGSSIVTPEDEANFLESEWLGFWMEGSGGWNGGHMELKEQWEATRRSPWPSCVDEALPSCMKKSSQGAHLAATSVRQQTSESGTMLGSAARASQLSQAQETAAVPQQPSGCEPSTSAQPSARDTHPGRKARPRPNPAPVSPDTGSTPICQLSSQTGLPHGPETQQAVSASLSLAEGVAGQTEKNGPRPLPQPTGKKLTTGSSREASTRSEDIRVAAVLQSMQGVGELSSCPETAAGAPQKPPSNPAKKPEGQQPAAMESQRPFSASDGVAAQSSGPTKSASKANKRSAGEGGGPGHDDQPKPKRAKSDPDTARPTHLSTASRQDTKATLARQPATQSLPDQTPAQAPSGHLPALEAPQISDERGVKTGHRPSKQQPLPAEAAPTDKQKLSEQPVANQSITLQPSTAPESDADKLKAGGGAIRLEAATEKQPLTDLPRPQLVSTKQKRRPGEQSRTDRPEGSGGSARVAESLNLQSASIQEPASPVLPEAKVWEDDKPDKTHRSVGRKAPLDDNERPWLEVMDSLSLHTVEEWRGLRMTLRAQHRATPVVQVLGHVLTPKLAAVLQHSLDKWIESSAAPGRSSQAVHVVGWDTVAWATGRQFSPEERLAIEAGPKKYLRPYVQLRMKKTKLPEDLPICDSVTSSFIAKPDPRAGLHGQEGLFARQQIPRGTVIGPLRCAIMSLAEHHAWKYSSTAVPEGFDRRWWEAINAAYELELTNDDVNRAFPWIQEHLVLSMVRDGNATALINDPEIDPLAYRSMSSSPKLAAQPNVFPMIINFMGFPLVLVVALNDIHPGQELVYRYGKRYWSKLREGLLAANAATGHFPVPS